MLLGEEGRRKMDNLTKTNDQLFSDYYDIILNTHTYKSFYEAKRLLELFRIFLGQVPPSATLAVQFLTNFKSRKLNTRARYSHVLGAFFRWFNGEKLPIKIKVPKILPQYVPGEDIDRLITQMENKKSHKGTVERDILLIETARMTGLRRSELANLRVGDLHLDGNDPVLVVRGGKGEKDRAVGLNMYIRNKLAEFISKKSPKDSVFGLKAKSISGKIRIWANKAGVPQLHTHSLRHYVGTTLFQRNANPRAVQTMMGHESLETTMRYAAVIGKDMQETAQLLEKQPEKTQTYDPTAGIMPVVFSKEPKKNCLAVLLSSDGIAQGAAHAVQN
jgi:integrase